jgi:hypothetical protein
LPSIFDSSCSLKRSSAWGLFPIFQSPFASATSTLPNLSWQLNEGTITSLFFSFLCFFYRDTKNIKSEIHAGEFYPETQHPYGVK